MVTVRSPKFLMRAPLDGKTCRDCLAAADENRCCIVGQIRTSAEVPDIPDEAVDAGPWPLKVFDEAILAILLLCVVRGFGDAVGIKQ